MIGYHYCSLDTFLNILRNKSIYLSDPLKMNDTAEIKWYLNRINDVSKKTNGYDSVLEMMRFRSGIDFCFEDLLNYLKSQGKRSIYISCFSEEPDLLSQWRAYADDGKGVSIGFDLNQLATYDNWLIEKVIYTNDIVQGNIENDVEVVADGMPTVFSEHQIIDKGKKIEIFLNELMSVLAKYKNPSFEEEKEVRLIYCEDMMFEEIIDSYGAFQNKFQTKKLKHEFRTIGGNNITEFVKLPFVSAAVKHICIGPKCLLSESDVLNITKSLLNETPTVTMSKSSYR